MRKTILAVALAAAMTGCTWNQVADNAEAANALLTLEASYNQANDVFWEKVSTEFTDDQLEKLVVLEERTTALVEKAKMLWKTNPALAAVEWEELYLDGKSIYLEGEAIISPMYGKLDPVVVIYINEFVSKAVALDMAYAKLKDTTDSKQEMLRAGIELAKLALQVSVMVL